MLICNMVRREFESVGNQYNASHQYVVVSKMLLHPAIIVGRDSNVMAYWQMPPAEMAL